VSHRVRSAVAFLIRSANRARVTTADPSILVAGGRPALCGKRPVSLAAAPETTATTRRISGAPA
jgi:hypothetical protein